MASDTARLPICTEAGRELWRLMVPKDVHDDSKRWFSRTKIERGFTLKNVQNILKCFCERCKRHLLQLKYSPTGDIGQRLDGYANDIVGKSGRPGSQILFALLLHIDFPMLILPFLDKRKTDGDLRHYCAMDMNEYGDRDYLIRQLQFLWQGLTPQALQDATIAFVSRMYRFVPAQFDQSDFAHYPAMTIMPFEGEAPVGSGVSASVFRFNIAEECIEATLKNILRTNAFARKRFNTDTNLLHFLRERSNLGVVQVLQDPHIVSVWKSYRRGDEYNIIFPLAEGNVDELMKNPDLGFRSLTHGPLRQARLWSQMRGLARALDRIINYDTDPTADSRVFRELGANTNGAAVQILGYHFDIKPANLLAYRDEYGELVLKITDFGQAHFQRHMTHSEVGHPGGTISYAAPEGSLSRDNKLNTRYDVWSLGCVFLELIVCFLGDGWKSVEQFRNERYKIQNHHGNYCFYDLNSTAPRRITLRPVVIERINTVFQYQDRASDDDNVFLQRMKTLILNMLQPDVQQRWTSRNVYDNFNDILAHEVTPSQSQSVPMLQQEFGTPERAVAGHKLGSLRQIYGRPRGLTGFDFQRCYLQDFGTVAKLRLSMSTIVAGRASDKEVLLDRSELEVVPKYAFRKSDHTRLGDWDVLIASTDGTIMLDYEFRIGPLEEARLLQGFLTGHEVVASFELADVVITEHQGLRQQGQRMFEAFGGLTHGLMGHTARSRPPQRNTSIGGTVHQDPPPYTVQLWREAVRRGDHELSPATDLRRKCRAVIFKSDTIITVPFSDATRTDSSEVVPMVGRDPPSPRRDYISFYPTKKLNQAFIEASFLYKRDNSKVATPGIPMSLDELYRQEHQSKKRLDMIKLVFRSDQYGRVPDTQRFANAYIDLKEAWRRELHTV